MERYLLNLFFLYRSLLQQLQQLNNLVKKTTAPKSCAATQTGVCLTVSLCNICSSLIVLLIILFYSIQVMVMLFAILVPCLPSSVNLLPSIMSSSRPVVTAEAPLHNAYVTRASKSDCIKQILVSVQLTSVI